MSTGHSSLITGASTGIGAAYAERFARCGHNLVIVAREKARLEALAARMREESGVEVEVLPADATKPSDPAVVEARLRDDKRIGFLVNNAGAAQSGGILQQSAGSIERLIAPNTTSLT